MEVEIEWNILWAGELLGEKVKECPISKRKLYGKPLLFGQPVRLYDLPHLPYKFTIQSLFSAHQTNSVCIC